MERKVDRLLTEKQVQEMTGLSHTSIWRWQLDGKFPQRRIVSDNRTAWLESEIVEWMHQLPTAEILEK